MQRSGLYRLRALVVTVSVLLAIAVFGTVYALTTSTTVRPNSTVTGGWAVGGTADATCTGNCQYVDEVTADGNTSYLSSSAANVEEYGMTDITGGQRATNIKLRIYMTKQSNEGCTLGTPSTNQLTMNIRINGTLQTQANKNPTGSNGTYSWYEQDYPGTWTQADINTLQARYSKTTTTGCLLGGTNATFRVSTVEAVVTWLSPDLNQDATRTYLNTDNVTPGAPLAATNAVADVATATQFRLRTGITASTTNWLTGTWGAHSNTYKLQFASKGVGTCSAPTGAWGDVQAGSGAIRWYNNPSVADGATISSYANDPTTSGTKIYQTYRESNSFGLSAQTNTTQTALWDFALQDVSSTPGTRYCFRILKNDGSTLETYGTYPEIVITGSLTTDIVDGSGVSVASPSFSFNSVIAQLTCQQTTSTLGVASQKIRITNDLVTNGWTTSIAATGGPTALWSAGSLKYDYNDGSGAPQGCADGGDADSYGGQLRVRPSLGTLTPKAGCTNTGVSLGSDAYFTQGSIDSITLSTGTAGSSRFCYWDITGIGLAQQIPGNQAVGNYTLDFTMTVLAT